MEITLPLFMNQTKTEMIGIKGYTLDNAYVS